MHELIRKKRAIERNSACCVRNDRSGCVQTSEEECSVCKQTQLLVTWCLTYRSKWAILIFLLFLFPEYSGCVGKVAKAFQRSTVKW